jgi:hypothetical protein
VDKTTGIRTVPAPTRSPSELLAYETECRAALQPLLAQLLEMAVSAGWSRRTAASTLMFLAAKQVSAASENSSTAQGASR